MSSRTRHPNRTGLRVVPTPPGQDGPGPDGTLLCCRCPVRTVAGTVWAYNPALGWHQPAEHGTWTPPRRPVHAPLPPELLEFTEPEHLSSAADPSPISKERHALAPDGPELVACRRCQLVFDAGAYARSRQALPACLPTSDPELSAVGPTVPDDQEDA